MRRYPTTRAVVAVAAGCALGAATALVAPGLWGLAALWPLAIFGLMLLDAAISASPAGATLSVDAPAHFGLGRLVQAGASADFAGRRPGRVEFALDAVGPLAASPDTAWTVTGETARFELSASRRGAGRIAQVSARWRGPLGLVWTQTLARNAAEIAVIPDIEGVKARALRLFSRATIDGLKVLDERADDGDLHALRDYQPGMDRRAIDWKQSARHGKLIAREYRLERNHRIALAIDTGRLMSAPGPRGARLDQAIDAALLLGLAALRGGDRVSLFGFDAKPRVASGALAGPFGFPTLQKLAAQLDYSTEESNFTLGLLTLSGQLDRRALVVVFTDFVDPTSAELMLENLGRLTRTHLVLFVTFEDQEVRGAVEARPASADDVTRAVVADALARQREAVLSRLQRLGCHVLVARDEDLGLAVVDAYMAIKRRGLL